MRETTAPGIADQGSGVALLKGEVPRCRPEPAFKVQDEVMRAQPRSAGAATSSEERQVAGVRGASGAEVFAGSPGAMLLPPDSETLKRTSILGRCLREATQTTRVHEKVETAAEPRDHRGRRMFARAFPFARIDAPLTEQFHFHRSMT